MVRRMTMLLVVLGLAGSVLAFTGCGGDDSSSASEDTTELATTEAETTEAETTEAESTEATATDIDRGDGDECRGRLRHGRELRRVCADRCQGVGCAHRIGQRGRREGSL